MAPRGKLKAENGRYEYPFFFLLVSLLFQLDRKNLEFKFDADSWTWPPKTRANREVSLCS